MLASLLSNPVEIWSKEHFELPIVVNATALGDRIVVSDPAAIKRVLVDNASNYVRDKLQRRILLRTTGRSLSRPKARIGNGSDGCSRRCSRRDSWSYVPGMVGAAVAASARLCKRGRFIKGRRRLV